MSRSLNISSLAFALLALAVLANPWNAPVVGGFRANDVLLLLCFGVVLLGIGVSRFIFTAYLVFFCVILASMLSSLAFRPSVSVDRVAFIYKYSLFFFIPISAVALLKTEWRIRVLEQCLFIGFLVLVAWVYLYGYAVGTGVIHGVDRASFPGSTDYLVSDAHLYSNYLGLSLLFYVLHLGRRLGHGSLVLMAVFLLALGALILTGSRNGLLALAIGFFLAISLGLFYRSIVIGQRIWFLVGLLSIVAVGAGLYFWDLLVDTFAGAAARAFNFALSEDVSSLRRLVKFEVAINDWLGASFLFGAGIFGSSLLWYDTGVGILVAHLGFLGLCVALFLLTGFYRKLISRLQTGPYRVSFVILSVYLFSNVITEFALVTRSALPVVLYICLPLLVDALGRQPSDRTGSAPVPEGKPA